MGVHFREEKAVFIEVEENNTRKPELMDMDKKSMRSSANTAFLDNFLQIQRDTILEIDNQGIIQFVSPDIEKNFKVSEKNIVGRSFTEFIPLKYQARFTRVYQEFMEGNRESHFFEFPWTCTDGETKEVNIFIKPIEDDDGNRIFSLASMRDISQRKKLMATIKHMANHDNLTDLASRGQFIDQLIQLLTSDEDTAFAVLLLDVDHFKKINDSLGFTYGELVLQTFAYRLKQILPTDCVLARMAADEFGILIKVNYSDSVEQKSQQLKEIVSRI